MAHAREQIRKAVETALTGLTTTGTNVSTSMIHAYQEEDLPALSIATAREAGTEDIEVDTMGTAIWRVLSVTITGRAKAVSGVEDTLDDIAAEVEAALTADAGVGALIHDVRLDSTEIELDGEGDTPIGAIQMDWLLTYRVNYTDPTVTV